MGLFPRPDGGIATPRGWLAPVDLVLRPPQVTVLTPPCLWPQIQNLGLFPIHGMMMKITIPIATRSGNRLLKLRDFLTDQVVMALGAG